MKRSLTGVDSGGAADRWVLVGGSGFLGTAVARRLVAGGLHVTVVDRHRPRRAVRDDVDWIQIDLLEEEPVLPPGRVVVLTGSSDVPPVWQWTSALDNAVTMARLAPALVGRDVVLCSSVEVYGSAAGPLTERSAPTTAALDDWVTEVMSLAAAGPCPPWRAAPTCRKLADAEASGGCIVGLAKLAQEQILGRIPTKSSRVVRLGNLFGVGQDDVVAELVSAALGGRELTVRGSATRALLPVGEAVQAIVDATEPGVWNVAGTNVRLDELAHMIVRATAGAPSVRRMPARKEDMRGVVDSSVYLRSGGTFAPFECALAAFVAEVQADTEPLFEPPLPVVRPARPARPDLVADRQAHALWNGALKFGQRWSSELTDRLLERTGGAVDEFGREWVVLPTVSGTAALRLAVAAVAGPARPGEVAVVPSFTFPATAEVVIQLGYSVRFVDVDRSAWTIDADAVASVLQHERVGVVVGVDTFGNPLAYGALGALCAEAGVPFVADSAAAIGSTVAGRPVGRQADAHAFSLSFAKTLIAGGAGGAVALRGDIVNRTDGRAGWSRSAYISEFHAIAALDQIEVLDQIVRQRQLVVDRYRDRLGERVVPQLPSPGADAVLAHFVARFSGVDRAMLVDALAGLGVETKPYFPALHRTSHLSDVPLLLPVRDVLHEQALALPLSSEMTERDADRVVAAVERALNSLVVHPRRSANSDDAHDRPALTGATAV